jgi:hypothetical protein
MIFVIYAIIIILKITLSSFQTNGLIKELPVTEHKEQEEHVGHLQTFNFLCCVLGEI